MIKCAEVFWLDQDINELHIISESAAIKPYKLFWTYHNDVNTEDKNYITSDVKKKIEFILPVDKKKRIFFILEFEDGTKIIAAHRILPIDGMFNFRDIGGYLTKNGKRLRWGMSFRSDHLYNLEDSGLDLCKSLGIQTVFDLRSISEAELSPDRNIGESNYYLFDPQAHIAMVAGKLQNGNDDLVKEVLRQVESGLVFNLETGTQKMINQQLEFATSDVAKECFGEVLKILAHSEFSPSVQHCRGGKDRTGFSLMLLEGILGLDEELLVYDYMLTKRARSKKNEKYYQRFLNLSENKDVADYLFSLFDTREEFIRASLSYIIDNYGSFESYALEELNVTEQEIYNLKDIFLE